MTVSDTHNKTMQFGELGKQADLVFPKDFDCLIHAGDFTGTCTDNQVKEFDNFLKTVTVPHKFVIAGNHDITFDEEYYKRAGKRFHYSKCSKTDPRTIMTHCTYLQDQR